MSKSLSGAMTSSTALKVVEEKDVIAGAAEKNSGSTETGGFLPGLQQESSTPSSSSDSTLGGIDDEDGTSAANTATSAAAAASADRSAFRRSSADAFSSQRSQRVAANTPCRNSIEIAKSVTGAGWDDPSFDGDTIGTGGSSSGNKNTHQSPEDYDDYEEETEEEEERAAARRKVNFACALLRMGSSTVTEKGSNTRTSKSAAVRRGSLGSGRSGGSNGHGRVARFVPPPEVGASYSKRLSDASTDRYQHRAYRRSSMEHTDGYDAIGVPSTTETGLSSSMHYVNDPYVQHDMGAAALATAAAAGTSHHRRHGGIQTLPSAPHYHDDSESSVGLSNPDDDGDDDFKDNEDDERRNLNSKFKREYRAVSWVKLAVLAVLGASMAVVVVLIYRLAKNEERDDFRVQYDDLSAKVMSGFHHNMDMKVWSAYTLSVMYAHEGTEEGTAWPNVTLADFNEQVEGILLTAHAGAKSISFSPLVEGSKRSSWETYAAHIDKHGYVSDSGDQQGNTMTAGDDTTKSVVWEQPLPVFDTPASTTPAPTPRPDNSIPDWMKSFFDNGDRRRGLRGGELDIHNRGRRRDQELQEELPADVHRTVADGIFRTTEDGVPVDMEDGQDLYLPIWQMAPAQGNDHHIMYNLKDDTLRSRAIDDMLFYRRPTLTEIYDGHVDPFIENKFGEPSAILFHPIFRDYCGSDVVGAISTVFTIGPQIKGLPKNIKGMTCVLETNTGQQFTYNIDGGGYAQLIGESDLHETKYDDMLLEQPFNLQSYQVYDDDEREAGCARRVQAKDLKEGEPLPPGADQLIGEGPAPGFGVGNDDGGAREPLVVMNVKIYPSTMFEQQYMTRNPAIYALVISLIFLVTSATFLIYDCLVEKRQNEVMNTAVKHSKIVNNLFPSQVRDRLFNEDEEKNADNEVDGGPVPGFVSNCDIDGCDEVCDLDTVKQGAPGDAYVAKEGRAKRRNSLGFRSGFGSGGGGLSKTSSNHSGFADDATLSTHATGRGISGPPIADLFTDTTIMFADIAGFTAWSSEREPAQVFQLLEALYREFDRSAKRAGVFKVETIGDCYVAVAGCPEPQPDHAIIMCKFAQKCLHKFNELSKELELSLGPGTADLGLRVGLHSGPVTGGVLRGERARFQLFGDTMNTASRMESTSLKNMVQISKSTADILTASGRSQMFVPREGLVQAKGKGEVQTYWLCPRSMRTGSLHGSSQNGDLSSYNASDFANKYPDEEYEDNEDLFEDSVLRLSSVAALNSTNEDNSLAAPRKRPSYSREESQRTTSSSKSMTRTLSSSELNALMDLEVKDDGDSDEPGPSEELQRLVKWNAAVLERFLVKVIEHGGIYQRMCSEHPEMEDLMEACNEDGCGGSGEAAEVIPAPWFDRESAEQALNKPQYSSKYRSRVIPESARRELQEYVLRIAMKYQAVHFHAFEHASHVTMSANKLMNKICSRESSLTSSNDMKNNKREREVDLFFSTFGIGCDPLAQLAVVFAALVHDVEHTGVPNARLAVENPDLANRYNNKSVAEQNSAHVAWDLLMEPEFVNLRRCMFSSACTRDRFRKLIVNVLVATDIADRERISKEKVRWQKAFQDIDKWKDEWNGKSDADLAKIDVSDKATCVLEQIVLASDVAHTMQHWLTFVKWNERLYKELWAAYKSGRAENDPTIGWYESQIGFYDGYIIPLATKLKECGVFGNAGEEYLGNALSNKQEWIEKGREISARFDETIKYADDFA